MSQPRYTASPGPGGFSRVLRDGVPLSPEQVQAEMLNLLAEIAEAARVAMTPQMVIGPVVDIDPGFKVPGFPPRRVVEVAPGVQAQGNPGVTVEAGPQGPVVSATRLPAAPPAPAKQGPSQKGKDRR